MKKLKTILFAVFLVSFIVMIFKLSFSTYYWRMINDNLLKDNFIDYFRIDANFKDVYEVFKFKYVPFLELGIILATFFPFGIMCLNLKEKNDVQFKQDFIIIRFEYIDNLWLGIRRIISLLTWPFFLTIILTPLFVSFSIVYIIVFKEYREYNEP